MAGVLVFGEVKDGRLKKASREALSIARKLGAGEVAAFAADRSVADDAGRYGAKRVFIADIGPYSTEVYASALEQAIAQMQPSIVLFGGTSNGRDLAPRIAARLDVGVASDVDRLE